MSEYPEANHIKIDLFPAMITSPSNKVPGGFSNEFKIIVTDNYFYVFGDLGTGPGPLIQQPLVSFDGSNKVGYTVVTEQDTFTFQRSTGCGCGSRLRGFNPFPGVPHISRLG